MPRDHLKGAKDYYDVIVVGSGLAGLTAANMLARFGISVLLLEHHYQLGGMATWFKRKGGHIFDISLHGFPIGMIKSCRRYWTKEIADNIHQLKGIRFDNPQFNFWTTFDRQDFTDKLVNHFGVLRGTVEAFFDRLRKMNYYDKVEITTRDLFKEYFPGRTDVWRLLMEPIAYANGSTLDDPAITYGIVFSNFMSKGVYIYQGGTDDMVGKMKADLIQNGCDVRIMSLVEKVLVENGRVGGVVVNGRTIRSRAVISNAGLMNTIFKLAGEDNFPASYIEDAKKVRLNNSSCQVYMGLKKREKIDYMGDLFFTSTAQEFDSDALCAKKITSRTYSFYYPDTRPGSDRYAIVSSTNANYEDWASLSDEEYEKDKKHLIDDTLDALEGYLPDIRKKIDWIEAGTPRTFQHYTRHMGGATFGTKFEGLPVSMSLPDHVSGFYHAGSVGIIMSGWLGTINYGVIVANKVASWMSGQGEQS